MGESDAYWAITLSGDQFDLLEWSSALPKPFDPWVDTLRVGGADRHILGSAEFVRMNSPAEVQGRAFVMLEALNGAMRAFQGTDSVKCDDVISVQADGTVRRHLLMSAKVTIRSRLYIKDNGPIVQTNVQKAFALAARNDFVADMLAHSAKENNWYDLYKMYECVRELSGEESRRLEEIPGVGPIVANGPRTRSLVLSVDGR